MIGHKGFGSECSGLGFRNCDADGMRMRMRMVNTSVTMTMWRIGQLGFLYLARVLSNRLSLPILTATVATPIAKVLVMILASALLE